METESLIERARKELSEEATEKAGKEVEKITAQKLEEVVVQGGKKAEKTLLKKAFSSVPVGGIVGEIIFASPDASAKEILARGIGSEIGIGPLDVTTAYDFIKWTVENPHQDERYIYYPGEKIDKETGKFHFRPGVKW